MKVLYLITKSNWGGAQRHIFDLAVSMKNNDNDVSVALGGDGLLRTNLESAGIYTHSISNMERDISFTKDFGTFKEIISIIRHRRPDILHVHSPKAAGLGSLAGRLFRVPKIIYTVHGWTFNEDRPLFQRILIIFFSWLTIILSHKTILISNHDYQQALHFPWVKNKIRLVPLGIKMPTLYSIDGAKQIIAKKINMPVIDFNKKIVIGTIAELHPNKGLAYLIKSFVDINKQYPQSILIIIGDGQDKSLLENLIKELKLEQVVFLTGYIENAAEYIKAFTVFTLSSLKEGLPYVILEAGSANLPIVATTVGGIPEIIEDMKSGILVQTKNIRELTHAISFMIEHPDERRVYANNLKEKINRNFSLENMIEGVRNVYNE